MPTGISMRFWLVLSAALLPCIYSAIERSKGSQRPGPLLSNAAMIRGIDELAISESAMRSAKDNSRAALSTQKELVAKQALDSLAGSYAKVTSVVPEAKAAMLKVRKFAHEASQHRDHTQQVENEWRHIPDEAAELVRKTTAGWISADATKAAEAASAHEAATMDKKGSDEIAEATAAAAEPYHLALLRNQKFCEETYNKAKTAQESSLKLIGDGKALSLKAQELQASGQGVEALESMSVAKGMMTQAEELRQWSIKLYSQANTACSTAQGYTQAEQQAAFSAAATTVVNAPMKLPRDF